MEQKIKIGDSIILAIYKGERKSMKKLIAVLALVALISGAAFAQVSGEVIGSVDVVGVADFDDVTLVSGGDMNRIRLEAAGATDGDVFGGWIRVEMRHWSGDIDTEGYAFWKPIPQFKLIIGGFSDGFYGKEGYAGWMFYQKGTDHNVSMGGGNVWSGSLYDAGYNFRNAFFGGAGNYKGAFLEIKPMDILSINVAIPFFDGGEFADIIQDALAQVDLNLDFGNIAITYDGRDGADGNLFVYFGLNAVENLELGIGFGTDLGFNIPAVGVGMKFGFSDSFALKFRAVGVLAEKDMTVLVDVMPIIGISDNMTAFISLGLGMYNDLKDVDFHLNPYIQVGSEWGPSFWAGIKLMSSGSMKKFGFAIPIAIGWSF